MQRFLGENLNPLHMQSGVVDLTALVRTAIVSATIVDDSVIMLVSSSTTNRFRKGQETAVRQTAESFRVALAPKTGMAIRAKERT